MPNPSSLPQIVLIGAAGRMGRAVASRLLQDGRVDLVGAVDPADSGKPVGALAGIDQPGPTVVASAAELPDDLVANTVLDFSMPEAVRSNLPICLERGWDYLIGVTGFTDGDRSMFADLAQKHSRRVVLVPNFTIGVNLMFRFAREASRIFDRVEIIEMHHDRKADAPSGTALHTAAIMGMGKVHAPAPGPDDPSRGRIEDDIPIHAVRLPGLIAHQEILFGSEGEILTIRHDTTDRSAFLSGIYLTIEKLPGLKPGFVTGLDWAFG